MNTLASLSPSQSRPAGINTLANPRGHVDPQGTLANRLANRLGLEPGALDGKRDDFTPDKVADRIIGFIEQRLKSEAAAGADTSKLEGLLAQAREGVEKGFAEARKILDGMGVLKGKVAEDIDATYEKIQSGLKGLESDYLAKTPASSGNAVAVAARSERFAAQAETFDMQPTGRRTAPRSPAMARPPPARSRAVPAACRSVPGRCRSRANWTTRSVPPWRTSSSRCRTFPATSTPAT
jgi:hypothetical protein